MRTPLIAAWALVTWIASTVAASGAFWLAFGACVVPDPPEVEPQARLIASWDPLACGDPHRVVVELEDEAGARLRKSVPCEIGGLSIDVPHWGIYHARIYAWSVGPEIRSVLSTRLEIDAPIVHWSVATPR